MMRGLSVMILLGAALGCSTPALSLADTSHGVTTGCPSEPVPGSTHATVPPELQLLERKTQHLRLSSIRLSYHMVVTTPTGTLVLNDITETRRSPSESLSAVTLEELNPSGKSSREVHKVLEIGDTIYEYQPTLTHGDGGRPWVRKRRQRSHPGSNRGHWSLPSNSSIARRASSKSDPRTLQVSKSASSRLPSPPAHILRASSHLANCLPKNARSRSS